MSVMNVTSVFKTISQIWSLLLNNTDREEENLKSLPSLKQPQQDTSKRPTQAVQERAFGTFTAAGTVCSCSQRNKVQHQRTIASNQTINVLTPPLWCFNLTASNLVWALTRAYAVFYWYQ
jgi:hypothetical protein